MESTTSPPAPEEVLLASRTTLAQYKKTFERFESVSDAPALALLSDLRSALEHLDDRLESIADDESLCETLSEINVVGPTKGRPFMEALHGDLNTIRLYLELLATSNQPVASSEVTVYVQAADRYGRILKMVLNRKAK